MQKSPKFGKIRMGQSGALRRFMSEMMGQSGAKSRKSLKNNEKKMTHRTPPQIAFFANKNNDLFAKRDCCVTCVKIFEPRRGEEIPIL